MVDRSLRLTALDNNHIVLDIGMTYTKCGFSKDSMPMHIVPTPLTMIQAIRDNSSKLNACSFANAFEKTKQLMMELEEFLTFVFYHLLQTNPREKAVVVCETLMTQRVLTESIGHVLFKNFGVKSIFFFLSNMLPIYATGQDSGIVVECGFQQIQIMPIVRSRLCVEGFQSCYTGGIHIEKQLNANIVTDNKDLIKRNGGDDRFNFPSHILEDLKVNHDFLSFYFYQARSLLVMQKEQRDLYMQNEQNLEMMKKKKYNLGKTYKDFQTLQISFFTRYTTMESCFGDPNEEEPNIAYSILKSVKKLNLENRGRAVQNIILSGGTCMVPGFKKRVLQELKHFLQTKEEFEELKELQELITIPESCFPPNCLVWVGASLLSSLNNEIDTFLITFEEYDTKYNQEKIPDRFGDAYLFATRKGHYFNKDFEENLRIQKQILYSNTTPYSARSLASKREPIATMLKKSLQNMGGE